MTALATAAVIVLAAAIVGGVAFAVRWAISVRRARLKESVRPVLFRVLEAGHVDLGVISALKPARQRALESDARSLLPKLRGRDHDTLARLLERRGAVEEARRQTRSRRPAARAEAGAFLGEVGSPSALPDLVALLRDADFDVRSAAAQGLARIGNAAAVPALLSGLEGRNALPVDLVIDVVGQIRDCPISVLRQGLRSHSVPTRAATVELLGRFQAFAVTAEIADMLENDRSHEVRARAARALGRIGSPHAVEPLLACLDSGPPAVRAQAVWALGELGGIDAVPALRAIILGPSRQLGEQAARALARIRPLGTALLGQLAEGDGPAAESARQALAEVEIRPLLTKS